MLNPVLASSQAFNLCKKAADNGDNVAQYQLGMKKRTNNRIFIYSILAGMYAEGIGCQKDFARALYYYQLSADRGNLESMFMLGI